MNTLLPPMAAMMHDIINNQSEAIKKLKATCNSEYGFLAVKGKFIPFLTPRQLAETWSVSIKTLERWRKAGTGPAFVKIYTKQIRYPIVELDKWVRENLKTQDSSEMLGVTDDSQCCNNGDGCNED